MIGQSRQYPFVINVNIREPGKEIPRWRIVNIFCWENWTYDDFVPHLVRCFVYLLDIYM